MRLAGEPGRGWWGSLGMRLAGEPGNEAGGGDWE